MSNKPPENSLQIVQQAEQIVAKVDKDAFRAMFYLFAGKPDSKQRAFEGRVVVGPQDVSDLARKIADKFALHGIDTEVVSVSTALQKKKTLDFASLAEFERQNWKYPEELHELTARWDFMIRIPSHVVPQRHTLTVRIARNSPSPEGMKVMINEMSQQIMLMGVGDVCIAKIDFINHQLADELLNLVGDWHAALRRPANDAGLLRKLEPYDRYVANGVRVSLPVAIALCLYGYVWHIFPQTNSAQAVTVGSLRTMLCIGFASVGLFLVANFVGKLLGGKMFEAINSFGGHHPFAFTRGDEAAQQRIRSTDQSSMKQFWILIVLPLLVNLIAGVVLWRLLPPTVFTP